MTFIKTKLKDAIVIELEEKSDDRGFFARSYCQHEFEDAGIPFKPVQANLSFNEHSNTLRGMHYQQKPYEEAKLVRCIRGGVYDVIVDIRDGSPTRNEWMGVELSADNRKSLFVPKGFAHGFLTLEPETEVHYLMSEFYTPGSGSGFRWDDPYYGIEWPDDPNVISLKDREWPQVMK